MRVAFDKPARRFGQLLQNGHRCFAGHSVAAARHQPVGDVPADDFKAAKLKLCVGDLAGIGGVLISAAARFAVVRAEVGGQAAA